jgi:predicted transcriptional regulator
MENLKEEQRAASFEHSVENTRLENQPNELLAQVKARIEAEAKDSQARKVLALKKGSSRT